MTTDASKKKEFKLRVYKFVLRLLKFLNAVPNNIVIIEIKKQCVRSGCSVGANYFESEAAISRKDYQNFFHISLKSANETKFWLAVIRDSGFCPKQQLPELEWLLNELIEIANILAASLITMKKNN